MNGKTIIGFAADRLFAAVGVATIVAGAIIAMPAQAKESVAVPTSYPAGMIIIKQSERQLYYTNGDGTAVRYRIAIGKMGKAWSGKTWVEQKVEHPDWSPPAVVARDHPELPQFIRGGAPNNPMGAAALTLRTTGSIEEVAIHGTTVKMRKSIGTAASYGCIRMLNEDVVDLYGRVSVGTPVVSIP